MSTHVGYTSFRAVYVLSEAEQRNEDLRHVDPTIRDEDEKFRRRVESVRHPLDLNSFLSVLKDVNGGRTALRIWKGSVSRKKSRRNAAPRFVVELHRISNECVLVVVHYRGFHDGYMEFCRKVQSGEIHLRIPQATQHTTESLSSKQIQIARWIQAPGNLSTRTVGDLVTEGPHIPKQLDRVDLINVLDNHESLPVSTVTGVIIKRTSYGLHLYLDGSDDSIITRQYPAGAIRTQDSWSLLRDVADKPDRDPCLVLSANEENFLESFSRTINFPVLIDGSAGSGKTTLLSLTLGALTHQSLESRDLPPPLLITYSSNLCDTARRRLIAYLVILKNVDLETAETAANQVCMTFTQVVNSILEFDPLTPAETKIPHNPVGSEWGAFLTWWNRGTTTNTFSRGGKSPEEAFGVLKQFVFGYFPTDRSPSEDEIVDAEFRRKASMDVHDITADELQNAIALWNDYRLDLKAQTLAERSKSALEVVLGDPERFSTWGHIIVDEVQDFSDFDIQLAVSLSQYSTIGIHPGESSNQPNLLTVALPLVLAGDEMQSIAPSGFTFSRCQATLEHLVESLSFELTTLPKVVKLTENFRNLQSIVELSTAFQRLASLLRRSKSVQNPVVHRQISPGVIERISTKQPLNHSIFSALRSASVATVVPCRWQEKERFLRSEDFARSINTRIDHVQDLDIHAIMTVEECKGMEYSTVLLCGFATAYMNAARAGHSRWILSALTVAVSRARDRIVFLDTNEAFEFMATAIQSVQPETDLRRSIEVVEFSISAQERAEVIADKFRNLALGTDEVSRTHEELASTIEILIRESDQLTESAVLTPWLSQVLASTSRAARTWLSYIQLHRVDSWDSLRNFDIRLWERVIDLALEDRSYTALQNLFPIPEIRGIGVERRLFSAACIIAINPNSGEKPIDRIRQFITHLDRFHHAGNPGWIAELVSRHRDVALHYQELVNFVTRTTDGWSDQNAQQVVADLQLIDSDEVFPAFIDVRSVITDPLIARDRLKSWQGTIPPSMYESLEVEILYAMYGLSWIDTEEGRQPVLELLRSGRLSDETVLAVMSDGEVQKCARRSLEALIKVASVVDFSLETTSKHKAHAAIAAVSAIVNQEVNEVFDSLQIVHEELQIERN